jgi:hypothetical protein
VVIKIERVEHGAAERFPRQVVDLPHQRAGVIVADPVGARVNVGRLLLLAPRKSPAFLVQEIRADLLKVHIVRTADKSGRAHHWLAIRLRYTESDALEI